MKKPFIFLGVAFTISLGVNIYLFKLVADWQEAWLEQTLTTAEIERLYRNSGADVSFESIKNLIERVKSNYKVVPTDRDGTLLFPADKDAILLNGTRLYFKDGQYIGSKANLPEGLVHWRLGQDEF